MENDFIEIKDPEVDIAAILKSIESRIPPVPSDQSTLEAIQKLDFSPLSPDGYRPFDPLAIAYAFEKGISPPKFTNPKLWFVRGPFKWLFIKIIDFYALVDKKLSENRIKAFFSVLHELIKVKKQLKNLEIQFSKLEEDLALLKGQKFFHISKLNHSSLHSYFDFGGTSEAWASALEGFSTKDHFVIFFPGSGHILKLFETKNIPFLCYSESEEEKDYLKSKITLRVEMIDFAQANKISWGLSHVCLLTALNKFSPDAIPWLVKYLASGMSPGTRFIFSLSLKTVHKSAFYAPKDTDFDPDLLPSFFHSFGLKLESELGRSSLEIIYSYLKS